MRFTLPEERIERARETLARYLVKTPVGGSVRMGFWNRYLENSLNLSNSALATLKEIGEHKLRRIRHSVLSVDILKGIFIDPSVVDEAGCTPLDDYSGNRVGSDQIYRGHNTLETYQILQRAESKFAEARGIGEIERILGGRQ